MHHHQNLPILGAANRHPTFLKLTVLIIVDRNRQRIPESMGSDSIDFGFELKLKSGNQKIECRNDLIALF